MCLVHRNNPIVIKQNHAYLIPVHYVRQQNLVWQYFSDVKKRDAPETFTSRVKPQSKALLWLLKEDFAKEARAPTVSFI